MRSSLLAGSVLLTFTTFGCGPSLTPQEVCQKMVDQMCERNFECRTDQDTAVFQYAYGANAEECKTRFYASNGCTGRTTEAQNCVGANAGKQHFSASGFEKCQEALGTLSCPDYVNQQNDPKQTPAACREMCD